MTEEEWDELIVLEEATWVAWSAAADAKRASFLAKADWRVTYAEEAATWNAWRAALAALTAADKEALAAIRSGDVTGAHLKRMEHIDD